MTVQEWSCTRDDAGDVHLQPLEDQTEHELADTCQCGPDVEQFDEPGDPRLVRHHTLDTPQEAP